MRKTALFCLALFTVVLIASCSPGATSTPVVPEVSALETATGAVWTGPWAHEQRKVCHHNEDYLTDGGYEWTVIQVNVGGQLNGHCGYQFNRQHGDYTTGGFQTCSACYLEGASVGGNCSFCD